HADVGAAPLGRHLATEQRVDHLLFPAHRVYRRHRTDLHAGCGGMLADAVADGQAAARSVIARLSQSASMPTAPGSSPTAPAPAQA
ncbi:MAG: hypothetical protein KJ832_02685, partial [Gammaproteobacteria bacterium]|nr:hypothetical protein [Gammaproteobacteria bacterium]